MLSQQRFNLTHAQEKIGHEQHNLNIKNKSWPQVISSFLDLCSSFSLCL